jgi:hypothetical protein
MSAEEFKERLDSALGEAIGRDDDLDEIASALDDARDRIDEIRIARGDA